MTKRIEDLNLRLVRLEKDKESCLHKLNLVTDELTRVTSQPFTTARIIALRDVVASVEKATNDLSKVVNQITETKQNIEELKNND